MKQLNETFEQVLHRRIERRGFLKTVAAVTVPTLLLPGAAEAAAADGLNFQPIAPSTEDRIILAPGYDHRVIIRWGDPVMPGAPATFDLQRQSPENQSKQFGVQADYVGFFPFWSFPMPAGPGNAPLQRRHSSSDWGLLVVNHEYTDPVLMFPTYQPGNPTRNEVDVELAAHGLSVIEVQNTRNGGWRYDRNSPFNRRLTGETEFTLTGPAAGHALLKTSADTSGTRVRGTLNNCGGGKTPWGTILSAEENFNQYFAFLSQLPDSDPRKAMHSRYALFQNASERRWENYHDRFNVAKEPNEAFRFGWVVEFDPYDPQSVPKKRTALGRFKHEAATSAVAPNGKVVIYSGDDERFEFMYKFVTSGTFNPGDRRANMDLLDSGTLYVAKFRDDGTGQWLPMVGGQGPLASMTQAEVLINTRRAGDLLGATAMDRPEDIELNPVNGKVYALMTNNSNRGSSGRPGKDGPNPRDNNRTGHIIEVTESGNDPAATDFRWEIFMLCGDPNAADTYFAGFDKSRVSLIGAPDNLVFDSKGNMWIATDGQPSAVQRNDAIHAVPVQGPDRGYLRQFMSAPIGAEVCGPELTPNDETFFAAIQHPGEGGTLQRPTSLWPDGKDAPKSSVIAIWKSSPGPKTIGS